VGGARLEALLELDKRVSRHDPVHIENVAMALHFFVMHRFGLMAAMDVLVNRVLQDEFKLGPAVSTQLRDFWADPARHRDAERLCFAERLFADGEVERRIGVWHETAIALNEAEPYERAGHRATFTHARDDVEWAVLDAGRGFIQIMGPEMRDQLATSLQILGTPEVRRAVGITHFGAVSALDTTEALIEDVKFAHERPSRDEAATRSTVGRLTIRLLKTPRTRKARGRGWEQQVADLAYRAQRSWQAPVRKETARPALAAGSPASNGVGIVRFVKPAPYR